MNEAQCVLSEKLLPTFLILKIPNGSLGVI